MMVRRRYSRWRRRRVRLWSTERLFLVLGATLYVLGTFGGLGLLVMPFATANLLLEIGGGLLLLTVLLLIL